MNILEGSKLCAEFLGWKKCDCPNPTETHYMYGNCNWQTIALADMTFHTDYNRFMSVYTKFRDLEFKSKGQYIIHDRYVKLLYRGIPTASLLECFESLVDGIKWYNLQKS
jgi:hypothetical protein